MPGGGGSEEGGWRAGMGWRGALRKAGCLDFGFEEMDRLE